MCKFMNACIHIQQDYGDEMRGCHTKENISDDEVIIEVPLKCLITVEMGKDTEVGSVKIEWIFMILNSVLGCTSMTTN